MRLDGGLGTVVVRGHLGGWTVMLGCWGEGDTGVARGVGGSCITVERVPDAIEVNTELRCNTCDVIAILGGEGAR